MRHYIVILTLLIFSFFLHGWNSLNYHTHKAITDDAIKSLSSSEYPDITLGYKEVIIEGSGGEGEKAHSGPNGELDGKMNGGHVEAIWNGLDNKKYPADCKNGVLENYANGLIAASYLNIGRICHLTNDQAVPAHAANIYHAFKKTEWIDSQDGFERWTDDNYITGLIANVGAISDDDFPYKYYQDLQETTRGKIENNATYSKYWRLSAESYKADATDYEIEQTQFWGTYTDEKYRKGIYPLNYTDDPAIVYYQLRDAVDNTARALATASIKLPSYIRPLNISNDIDPKLGTELIFKVYENRKNEITYSVFIDNTANYVVDVNGKLLKDIVAPLESGTLLPWEKEFSFKWNGKYKAGDTDKYPSFGKHKIIYKVKDKDDNETFKEYEVNYVPKVTVLVNGKNSYSEEYENGEYSFNYFNINLNKEQTISAECYHGEQKLDRTRFQFSYYIKTFPFESGPFTFDGLTYKDEVSDAAVKNKSTFNYKWNTMAFKGKSSRIRIVIKAPYTTLDQKSELFAVDSTQVDTYRPISLGTISMVFKKPDTGGKLVIGTLTPLQEKDTLSVTVPLSVEPDKWNGVEVLLDGELSPNINVPALPEPTYREYGDSIRVYKFVWDYSEQPEGFVTMRARYKDDPLSFEQKKIKVGFSNTWEDFEDTSSGLPGGWTYGTNYGYPLGNVIPGQHYFQTGYNLSTKSNELKASSFSLTAHRFEVLSPVITVPLASDDVETFLYFDYARELGLFTFEGYRSMLIMQYCDASGNELDIQPVGIGAMDTDDGYSVNGLSLNYPNFYLPNITGIDFYPDGIWDNHVFWLNMPISDLSGKRIKIKFIHLYTDMPGIIDNNTGFEYNPASPTAGTYHHIDNFQVRTFYMINLPPTIDKVADQEVKQHCGWQKINLTGITNGQDDFYRDSVY